MYSDINKLEFGRREIRRLSLPCQWRALLGHTSIDRHFLFCECKLFINGKKFLNFIKDYSAIKSRCFWLSVEQFCTNILVIMIQILYQGIPSGSMMVSELFVDE